MTQRLARRPSATISENRPATHEGRLIIWYKQRPAYKKMASTARVVAAKAADAPPLKRDVARPLSAGSGALLECQSGEAWRAIASSPARGLKRPRAPSDGRLSRLSSRPSPDASSEMKRVASLAQHGLRFILATTGDAVAFVWPSARPSADRPCAHGRRWPWPGSQRNKR